MNESSHSKQARPKTVAVVGGGMIPLLTLGVPGAPPDAVIYGVLMLFGLHPGPELFRQSSDNGKSFGHGTAAHCNLSVSTPSARDQ